MTNGDTPQMSIPSSKVQLKKSVLFLALMGLASLLFITYLTLTHAPAEDAVILHQYSRNLAETGMISYIAGGVHAEGATDFLWMLYIALGFKLHLSPTVSTALANITCAFALSYVLLRLARRPFHWVYALAVLGALALMPQTISVVAGFSVLPFGLAIATTVLFSEENKDRATAISAIVLCLLRPDGVIFAIPIIIRRLWRFPRESSFSAYGLLFVLPGIVYFLWRWHYFGYFFPLPFMVKSDTHRVWHIFAPTGHELIRYLLFAAIILGAALGKQVLKPAESSFLFAVILVPALFYSAMRLDQNIFFRFYYFIPLGVAMILAMHWDSLEFGRKTVFVAALCAFLLLLAKVDVEGFREYRFISAYWLRNEHIATQLSAMRGTLLTSEAGEFAYFSRWTTYDSWGLDTPEFATHLIVPEDVTELKPDLIALHTSDCTPRVMPVSHIRGFDAMFANIETGITRLNNYQTWRMTTSSSSGVEPISLCWYIRRDYTEKDRVASILGANGALRLAQ